jgi:hypothetical protein
MGLGVACSSTWLRQIVVKHKFSGPRLIRFAKQSGLVIDAYAHLAVRIFAFVALLVELFRALMR